MFTRWEVIVLTNRHTNKQTPLKTFKAVRYATTLGNNHRGRPREYSPACTQFTSHVSSAVVLRCCVNSVIKPSSDVIDPWSWWCSSIGLTAINHPAMSVTDFTSQLFSIKHLVSCPCLCPSPPHVLCLLFLWCWHWLFCLTTTLSWFFCYISFRRQTDSFHLQLLVSRFAFRKHVWQADRP